MKRFALILAVALSACASNPPPPRAVVEAAEKPLICTGGEQCKTYWQRAVFYVNQNSTLKVQTQTDDLIQTFSPTGGTTRVGYNISREPLQGGAFRLWVKVWCDNMFGCDPDIYREMARVKKYVSTGEK